MSKSFSGFKKATWADANIFLHGITQQCKGLSLEGAHVYVPQIVLQSYLYQLTGTLHYKSWHSPCSPEPCFGLFTGGSSVSNILDQFRVLWNNMPGLINVHTPCTSQNTHSNTCKHCLAAITMSIRLVQAKTHTQTHACITSQQEWPPWAYTLFASRKWSKNTPHSWAHIHTYMHHLAAITASIHLIHAHTNMSIHSLLCVICAHTNMLIYASLHSNMHYSCRLSLCVYTCGHVHPFVCMYAWAWSSIHVHIHMGMITPLCAYTCGHDHPSVCIYTWASSSLCVHIHVGLITLIVCTWQWAWLCTCVRMLEAAMSSAQAARILQCRSQAIMPRLSCWARWCTNIESWKGNSWPMQAQ